jgi:type IV pilus assembly protein PilB
VINLKNRGGLNTSQQSAPQTGSFNFDSSQIKTSIHIATMPTVTGEKVALRLTRQLSEPATLETLGFWGDALNRLEMGIA